MRCLHRIWDRSNGRRRRIHVAGEWSASLVDWVASNSDGCARNGGHYIQYTAWVFTQLLRSEMLAEVGLQSIGH